MRIISNSNTSNILVFLLLLVAFAIYGWEMRRPLVQLDDAFISYHYAQNFVKGHGLVFNVGERVEGFTNLLWVLLVALGIKLGFEAPVFGHYLSLFSGMLLLFSTYIYTAQILPRHAKVLAAFAPLILLSFNPFFLWTSSGLEQGLFSAFVVLSFVCAISNRYWWVCLFCILATVTRLEGVIVAAILLNVHWLRQMRLNGFSDYSSYLSAFFPAFVFGLSLFGLTFFRWYYYDDIVPNTFYAKVGGIPLEWALFYFRQFWIDGPIFLLPGSILITILLPKFRLASIYCCITIFYVLWIGGDVFRLGRFFLPILPLLVAGALAGAYYIYKRSMMLSVILIIMIPVAIVFSLIVKAQVFSSPYSLELEYGFNFPYSVKRQDARIHEINQTIDELVMDKMQRMHNAQPPIRLLASVGIGRPAYYGKNISILDLVGLTNKVIAKSSRKPAQGTFLLPGHQRSDPDYVFLRQPDFIDIPKKKDTPPPVLPCMHDLWNDPRLNEQYTWDEALGGYLRKR